MVCMEKTNIRYVTPADIDDVLDFASVDVSFISLTKVLIPARELLRDGGEMVCLIKPQFEAGREKVGKKGVVRDKAVHEEVVERIIEFASQNGFFVKNLEYSPIKGPEGNIEYLVYIRKDETGGVDAAVDIKAVVDAENLRRISAKRAENVTAFTVTGRAKARRRLLWIRWIQRRTASWC